MYGALVAAMLTTTSAASPDCLWWGGYGYGWYGYPAWGGWYYPWWGYYGYYPYYPYYYPYWTYYYTWPAFAQAQPAADAREQELEVQVRVLREQVRALRGGEASARVVVQLPEDARLFVDNDPCPLTSAKRSFDTPQLRPGVRYEYTIRAEVTRDGRTLKESKKVTVRAGEETAVQFGDMRSLQTAGR